MKVILNSTCFLILLAFIACNSNEKEKSKITSRNFNEMYKGELLNRVAFPIGGIGAGMFCLEGTGAISHVSVYNKPDVLNEPCMFAAISVKGIENGVKVLEGPVPDWKIFGHQSTTDNSVITSYGLPRFQNAEFEARFPFGNVRLKDDDIPLDITIKGWSPFIPLDEDNSSLPCGALEYKFVNNGNKDLEAVFSYNTINFMKQPGCKNAVKPISNGFILSNSGTVESPYLQGDFAIYTADSGTKVDHCWFRGSWYDPMSITWKSIEKSTPRVIEPVAENAPGASLFVPFSLKPGEEKIVRLMMSWFVPNSNLRKGEEVGDSKQVCKPSSGCCPSPFYQPWYSSRFKSINDVASYWLSNYNNLKERSELFKETFYSSTLPAEVLEAVAANLTILKSPTVLRQFDGKLWSWEGCKDDVGCCAGSCTHVWNYAQAIPHLFPSLERSLRETEFIQSQNEAGHQTFRAALPIRNVGHNFYSAADGQLGGIMKAYREWRISGDNEWLKKMYPLVKKSLEFSIKEWDPRETGSLEEPQHNTYDVEFWGPNGFLTSFYLGALKATILMGKYLGDDISRYQNLLDKGEKLIEGELYNGEYFIQKIVVNGLNAPSPVEAAKKSIRSNYSDEAKVLLDREGPKYQYGTGCLSDGILGMWLAKVCGIDEPIIHEDKVKNHLKSVYKYNFKTDLSNYSNPQRPTYAMKNEGGLLLCSWPKGGDLSLPFIYSNEVWTGIEYQVASHLMFLGMTKEALDIVRACRKRYDGKVRNPFNEFECGHWYARAMSSYGLIQGLTGVRYDAVSKALYIDSKIGNDFGSFFSCQTGYGTIGLKGGVPFVKMVTGTIDVKNCFVSGQKIEISELNNRQ